MMDSGRRIGNRRIHDHVREAARRRARRAPAARRGAARTAARKALLRQDPSRPRRRWCRDARGCWRHAHASALPRGQWSQSVLRAPPCAPRRHWPPALRITDCGPSATADSISTPRFIGCGCITMASGFAQRQALRREPELAEIIVAARNLRYRQSARFWMRSIITTSQPAMPRAMSCLARAAGELRWRRASAQAAR